MIGYMLKETCRIWGNTGAEINKAKDQDDDEEEQKKDGDYSLGDLWVRYRYEYMAL